MKITVFTPTYNRGYIIEVLYRSLQRQSFRDFEWIVIDDGSSDNTEILFEGFQKELNDFHIQYLKVQNGGKHRAINQGVKMARGELFFIVDSDDYLVDNALEQIVEVEGSIPEESKKDFAGICGCKGKNEDDIIGSTFEGNLLDVTSLEREKYHIIGDKAEIFYTNLLKRYPFPEFEGEKFLTESVVWDRIAHDGFKLRFFNSVIYICDYLEDGLTRHYDQIYNANPKGYGLYIYQSAQFGKISSGERRRKNFEYYFRFRGKLSLKQIADNLHMNSLALYCQILLVDYLDRYRKRL